MHAPQVILIVLFAIDLLGTAHLHGREKTGKWNFWGTLWTTLFLFWMLILGGFF